MILLYGKLARSGRQQGGVFASTTVFAGFYLAVWGGFSALAALVQWALGIARLGFVRVTAGRLRVAQHAHPQAKFKPRGRATRPMRQEPAAPASPSRGPGNGILRAETGGRIQAQNAGEQSEFGSQTTLRLTNSPELRGFLSTRKPPRFVGTAWWRTQSCETSLRPANSLLTGKRTGIWVISRASRRPIAPKQLAKSMACRRNSLCRRTGKFLSPAGNYSRAPRWIREEISCYPDVPYAAWTSTANVLWNAPRPSSVRVRMSA